MLQKIRTYLICKNQGILSGEVECDETFVGGKNKNRHWDKKVKNARGRSFIDKTPVFVAKKWEYNLSGSKEYITK